VRAPFTPKDGAILGDYGVEMLAGVREIHEQLADDTSRDRHDASIGTAQLAKVIVPS